MFRFAKKLDYLYMIIGTLFAMAAGGALPIFALLWGDMIDKFKSN